MISLENSNKSLDRFIHYLKIHGPQPASVLARVYDMTLEGARQQLAKLNSTGLVEQVINPKGVGRPTILYSITDKANRRYPDGHEELSLQLLSTVKNVLGQNALDAIINARALSADVKYSGALSGARSIEEKLERLATIRTEEGYLAEWKKEGDEYFFIENHCPIGSAAKFCQGFCRAELNTLSGLLGPGVSVTRTEYMPENGRRCTYKIILLNGV